MCRANNNTVISGVTCYEVIFDRTTILFVARFYQQKCVDWVLNFQSYTLHIAPSKPILFQESAILMASTKYSGTSI